MKASIVTIGDEILIGQIIDTNSAWIAETLSSIGISIDQIITVSDTKQAIQNGLRHAAKHSDIILMTGGLGPTADDITKPALAEYFGLKMEFNPVMFERIESYFSSRGITLTELHQKQCFLPSPVHLLKNELGTAPGMWFEFEGKYYISMPGVPYEMKYIMDHGVIPQLTTKLRLDSNLHHVTILTAGQGESIISERINDIVQSFPTYIKIAYLPGKGQVRLRISGRHQNKTQLVTEINDLKDKIVAVLGSLVFGYGKETLQEKIGQTLKLKNLTLSTAESCTGGKIAAAIVQTPGSSSYFQGSIIAYSYDLKKQLLDVDAKTLEKEGAVSEKIVQQMVTGALKRTHTDLSIAVSGIAGPSGGTEEKPVGTVWIACGNHSKIVTKKYQLNKDRQNNIDYTVVLSLNMLRLFLMGEEIA